MGSIIQMFSINQFQFHFKTKANPKRPPIIQREFLPDRYIQILWENHNILILRKKALFFLEAEFCKKFSPAVLRYFYDSSLAERVKHEWQLFFLESFPVPSTSVSCCVFRFSFYSEFRALPLCPCSFRRFNAMRRLGCQESQTGEH